MCILKSCSPSQVLLLKMAFSRSHSKILSLTSKSLLLGMQFVSFFICLSYCVPCLSVILAFLLFSFEHSFLTDFEIIFRASSRCRTRSLETSFVLKYKKSKESCSFDDQKQEACHDMHDISRVIELQDKDFLRIRAAIF